MAKLIDCFTFFDELKILKLRLETLRPVVDKFVLVEAEKTFTGKPKPLYFEKNKHRFEAFIDDIEHIVLDSLPKPEGGDPWQNEYYSRNSIMKGISDSSKNDLIVVSDVDEIPRPNILEQINKNTISVLQQTIHWYFLNMRHENEYVRWLGPIVLPRKKLRKYNPSKLRSSLSSCKVGHTPPHISKGLVFNSIRENIIKIGQILGLPRRVSTAYREIRSRLRDGIKMQIVPEGGWHFSYQGGVDSIIKKVNSFSHTEVQNEIEKNKNKLKKIVRSGQSVINDNNRFRKEKLNRSYPRYLLENKQEFSDMLI